MSDLKVASGEVLRAEQWNKVIDRIEGSDAGSASSVLSMSRVLVPVLNDSGRNYDMGEFLSVASYDGPSDTDFYDVPGSIELVCEEPVWHTSIANLLVTAEPIPDGERGRAVLSGHCVLKVTNTDSGTFAMPDPTTVYQGKVGDSGIAAVMGRVGDGAVLAVLGRSQPLWIYELTEDSQAPGTTTAKLLKLDLTDWSTTEIDLSDPLGIGDNDENGYRGYCQHIGNEFHIAPGPC